MNSLILSDMVVERRRKLGGEGKVLVKVQDVARKVVDVLSLAHVMTSNLPSFLPVISLWYLCFADRGACIFREDLRNGCLPEKLQRSV